jgi:hypothetical protein
MIAESTGEPIWLGLALLGVGVGILMVVSFRLALGIFLFLLFLPIRFSLEPARSITLADIALFFLFLSWFLRACRRGRIWDPTITPLDVTLILFVMSAFVSGIMAQQDRGMGMLGGIQALEMSAIYFIIRYSSPEEPRWLLDTIAWGLVCGCVFEAVSAVSQVIASGRAMTTGSTLAGSCFFLWKYRSLTEGWKTSLISLGLISGITAAVFSLSRGLWLAFSVGAVVLLFLEVKPHLSKASLLKAVRLGALITIAGLIFWLVLPTEIRDSITWRFESLVDIFVWRETATSSTWTVGMRWLIWQAAWEVFRSSPVFGVGPKNFFLVAGSDFILDYRFRVTTLSPHNQFLTTLSETGLVGLTLFILAIVMALARLRSVMKHSKDRHLYGVAVGLSAGILTMCASGMTADFAHGNSGKMLFIFFALCQMLSSFVVTKAGVLGPPVQRSKAYLETRKKEAH